MLCLITSQLSFDTVSLERLILEMLVKHVMQALIHLIVMLLPVHFVWMMLLVKEVVYWMSHLAFIENIKILQVFTFVFSNQHALEVLSMNQLLFDVKKVTQDLYVSYVLFIMGVSLWGQGLIIAQNVQNSHTIWFELLGWWSHLFSG